MLFQGGYTSYNQEDVPVKIRFLPFVAKNYGIQYTLYSREKYNLYLGFRMQHINENIIQTFASDQTDDGKPHQRNFIWDFYDSMFKFR